MVKNEITKGWSDDKKYYVEDFDGGQFLLRIADVDRYDRKKTEFEMMQRVWALGVPMQKPVGFGLCDGDKNVYVLMSWLDGEEAESALPLLPEAEQYALGRTSGMILRQIHSVPAPDAREGWEVRFNRKIDAKIGAFHKCHEQGMATANDGHFLTYVQNNCHLLKDRPQCLHHGDYHPGNMLIAPDGTLSVIDWNRHDFGDPWQEFDRIVFSAQTSPHFATGQLCGYFNGEPPNTFFELLAFYIASNALGALAWAHPFGKSEMDFIRKQNDDILRWYDNMNNTMPSWYIR